MIKVDVRKVLKAGHLSIDLKAHIECAAGSIIAIHGPSGAGKTTLLQIIAGLAMPEEGIIYVNNKTWLDTAAGINCTPQQRLAGFVFQHYALFPNMSVLRHLTYAGGDIPYIEKLLQIGGLEHLKQYGPAYLSGGQQQRLAILRAMAIKPQLLLMDEPFSAQDAQTKRLLIDELKLLWHNQGTTVFIVTHNPAELQGIANGEVMIG